MIVALGGAAASLSETWSKVRSASRRRKAVDQLVEHLAIECRRNELSPRHRKRYRAELQALAGRT